MEPESVMVIATQELPFFSSTGKLLSGKEVAQALLAMADTALFWKKNLQGEQEFVNSLHAREETPEKEQELEKNLSEFA